ncbi:hypothetical protein HYFRA_00012662 [Hymenoscyphus fraxineus]|uniref:Uncharacterized protein n=1 Tax=Hymenoscyphus fraxineus TaxID=746836 RepID=A0A9N9PY22_9HELO|nr:hypothetical protein HYFRA_00012662 [Hymenoscyphus fraxineus]
MYRDLKTAEMPRAKGKKLPTEVHRKYPGFNAFMTSSASAISKATKREPFGFRKKVPVREVAVPEIGIHSREWARKIVPQKATFFKLPAEIREKIWKNVIKTTAGYIVPRKARDKFTNNGSKELGNIMVALYTLCRQSYVDTYGSGFLYRYGKFRFPNSDQMLNVSLCVFAHTSKSRLIMK